VQRYCRKIGHNLASSIEELLSEMASYWTYRVAKLKCFDLPTSPKKNDPYDPSIPPIIALAHQEKG
jgi:hypothetical protein